MSGPRIVILGGGYAGLAALRRLRRLLGGRPASLLLVDRSDAHVVKTRLYEVAVTPRRNLFIRFPLSALARASGARFLRAVVTGTDLDRRLLATEAQELPYDRLVLAPGLETNYYGVGGARERAVSLQTYEGAIEGCRRFEGLGLRSSHGPFRSVVVCGAGLEGVEVAAAARQQAPSHRCGLTVVEKTGGVISQSQCTDAQRRYVRRYFERRAVELRLGRAVEAVEEGAVRLDFGEALPADLVYWCGGTRRSAVAGLEPGAAPLRVGEALRCEDHPDVFAAGDFAATEGDSVWTNLASAQRAIFHGEAAAENVVRSLDGFEPKPVRYRPAGEFVALGDFDGVGVYRGLPFYGLAAAALKRAVEARYLTELHGDLPPHLLRTALGTDPSTRQL